MFSWSGLTPDRVDDASEDVVAAPGNTRAPLDRLEVLRFLDDGSRWGRGARRGRWSTVFFREIAADVAVAHAPAHGVDRVNEARLIGLRVQDAWAMLRGLSADAGSCPNWSMRSARAPSYMSVSSLGHLRCTRPPRTCTAASADRLRVFNVSSSMLCCRRRPRAGRGDGSFALAFSRKVSLGGGATGEGFTGTRLGGHVGVGKNWRQPGARLARLPHEGFARQRPAQRVLSAGPAAPVLAMLIRQSAPAPPIPAGMPPGLGSVLQGRRCLLPSRRRPLIRAIAEARRCAWGSRPGLALSVGA